MSQFLNLLKIQFTRLNTAISCSHRLLESGYYRRRNYKLNTEYMIKQERVSHDNFQFRLEAVKYFDKFKLVA